jgi:hypothetical protein
VSDYARWRKALARANDPAFWPITAIDELIADGRAQFWATEHAALVTEVKDYPGGARAIEAIAGAGRKQDIIEKLGPAVEAWAGSIGATHLKVAGRAGWSRQMKPHGWRLFQEIIIKDLG